MLNRNQVRRRPNRRFVFGNFYLNPSAQYSTTVISAILFAGVVFSGFLLFRFTDTDDLMARGRRELYEGKVAWAAKTFETLVSRHKDSYEGYLLLGETYLQLGDRANAERAFWSATALRGGVKGGQTKDVQAGIALSKLAMARNQFDVAEKQLLSLWKLQPGSKDLLQATQDPNKYTDVSKRPTAPNRQLSSLQDALFSLYQRWGEVTGTETHNYRKVIAHYEQALRYANDFTLEEKVKEKLIEAISHYCDTPDALSHPDDMIYMLKKSLRYRYSPDSLIAIAEVYEKNGKLDDSIEWYRKAFDANPGLISLKLSNMLMQRGNQLLAEKKPDEAEALFQQAKHVNATANIPLDALYPVTLEHIKVTALPDVETGELPVSVAVTVKNQGERPIQVLQVRATFSADGEPLGEVIAPVATPDNPLGAKPGGLRAGRGSKANGAEQSSAAPAIPGQDIDEISLTPDQALNLNDLKGKSLQVKLAIAYTQDANTQWKDVAIKMVPIKLPTIRSQDNPSIEQR